MWMLFLYFTKGMAIGTFVRLVMPTASVGERMIAIILLWGMTELPLGVMRQ